MSKEDHISKPIVSVVMPVYNVRAYIEEAISSVLEQTFEDFESDKDTLEDALEDTRKALGKLQDTLYSILYDHDVIRVTGDNSYHSQVELPETYQGFA